MGKEDQASVVEGKGRRLSVWCWCSSQLISPRGENKHSLLCLSLRYYLFHHYCTFFSWLPSHVVLFSYCFFLHCCSPFSSTASHSLSPSLFLVFCLFYFNFLLFLLPLSLSLPFTISLLLLFYFFLLPSPLFIFLQDFFSHPFIFFFSSPSVFFPTVHITNLRGFSHIAVVLLDSHPVQPQLIFGFLIHIA